MMHQVAAFLFQRLEEKGTLEESEDKTTPCEGSTRLACFPFSFLHSFLLAAGKQGNMTTKDRTTTQLVSDQPCPRLRSAFSN